MESWRYRALNVLYVVITVAAVPAMALLLREGLRDARQWPAVTAYFYAFVLPLALLRRLSFLLRAWWLIGAGYATAVLAMARGGLMSDGRVYLTSVRIPVIPARKAPGMPVARGKSFNNQE